MLLTADAANKRGSWQHCMYCNPGPEGGEESSTASSFARRAERLLRDFTPFPFLGTESKVLRGKFGAFDFSLALQAPAGLRWLHAEVDGQTHFSKPRKGESVGAQKDVDRRKDRAAWQQGRLLVRLHYLDQGVWGQALRQAVHYAMQPGTTRFIIYTRSYAQLGLESRVESQEGEPLLPNTLTVKTGPWYPVVLWIHHFPTRPTYAFTAMHIASVP